MVDSLTKRRSWPFSIGVAGLATLAGAVGFGIVFLSRSVRKALKRACCLVRCPRTRAVFLTRANLTTAIVKQQHMTTVYQTAANLVPTKAVVLRASAAREAYGSLTA
jgi:hypothetical protein